MKQRISLAFIIVNILFALSSCTDKFEAEPAPEPNFTIESDTMFLEDIVDGKLTFSVENPIPKCYYYWNSSVDLVNNNSYNINGKEGNDYSITITEIGTYTIQLSAVNNGGLKQIQKKFYVQYKPLPLFTFSGSISSYSGYKICSCSFYIDDPYYTSNLIKTIYFSELNSAENYNFSADINSFYTNQPSSLTLFARVRYKIGTSYYTTDLSCYFNTNTSTQSNNFQF
ncbi:MAG: hypothetical protein WCK02_09435 [Bacteroidota bacterium]